ARAAAEAGQGLHEYLTERAAQQEVGQHGLIALDWHSGNRSTLVDHELSGLLIGQTLTTQPEDIYRALLESTAFGTRVIIEAFEAAGVPLTEFVVAGGLLKNSFLMQMYADVTRLPLSTIASSQGPALGSAIHAAVAVGPTRTFAPQRRRWGGAPLRPIPRTRRRLIATTNFMPSTCVCTTTSDAGATTLCTGSRRFGAR